MFQAENGVTVSSQGPSSMSSHPAFSAIDWRSRLSNDTDPYPPCKEKKVRTSNRTFPEENKIATGSTVSNIPSANMANTNPSIPCNEATGTSSDTAGKAEVAPSEEPVLPEMAFDVDDASISGHSDDSSHKNCDVKRFERTLMTFYVNISDDKMHGMLSDYRHVHVVTHGI